MLTGGPREGGGACEDDLRTAGLWLRLGRAGRAGRGGGGLLLPPVLTGGPREGGGAREDDLRTPRLRLCGGRHEAFRVCKLAYFTPHLVIVEAAAAASVYTN